APSSACAAMQSAISPPAAVPAARTARSRERRAGQGSSRRQFTLVSRAEPLQLVVAPFAVELGGPLPAQARATLTAQGYEIDLQGPAELPRLLELARSIGLHAPANITSGAARVDLAVAGAWAGFSGGPTTGL